VSRQVVITGIGPLTPFTAESAELWELIRSAETQHLTVDADCRVSEKATVSPSAQLRQMDRLGRLALTAAESAIRDAQINLANIDPETIGIALGSGYGCLSTNADYLEGIRDRGPRRGNPIVFQNTVSNAAAGYLSIAKDIRGPNATMCSGWTAGLEALDFGVYQIADGRVETMIVGSADQLFPTLLKGFQARGSISASRRPRPYDRERDGMVLSEGSCFLILEELEHARSRNARIYAEVAAMGHRSTGNGNASRALSQAVLLALREADGSPNDVDVIVSGASGATSDRWEGHAMASTLGPRVDEIPMIFPKAVLGETMATAGPLAVALAAMALYNGKVPSVQAPAQHDPECRLRIRATAADCAPELALVPLIDDNGNAAVTVLRRFV
jgi:3-oxoacyl-[acyl-carrier-protein] synthase II